MEHIVKSRTAMKVLIFASLLLIGGGAHAKWRRPIYDPSLEGVAYYGIPPRAPPPPLQRVYGLNDRDGRIVQNYGRKTVRYQPRKADAQQAAIPVVFLRNKMEQGFLDLQTRLNRVEATLDGIVSQIGQGTAMIQELAAGLPINGYGPKGNLDQGVGSITQPMAVVIRDDSINEEVAFDIPGSDTDITERRGGRAGSQRITYDELDDEENCDEEPEEPCSASRQAEKSPEINSIVSRKIVKPDSDESGPVRSVPVKKTDFTSAEEIFPSGRKVGFFRDKPNLNKATPTTDTTTEPVTTAVMGEIAQLVKQMEADDKEDTSTQPEEFRIDAEKLPPISE